MKYKGVIAESEKTKEEILLYCGLYPQARHFVQHESEWVPIEQHPVLQQEFCELLSEPRWLYVGEERQGNLPLSSIVQLIVQAPQAIHLVCNFQQWYQSFCPWNQEKQIYKLVEQEATDLELPPFNGSAKGYPKQLISGTSFRVRSRIRTIQHYREQCQVPASVFKGDAVELTTLVDFGDNNISSIRFWVRYSLWNIASFLKRALLEKGRVELPGVGRWEIRKSRKIPIRFTPNKHLLSLLRGGEPSAAALSRGRPFGGEVNPARSTLYWWKEAKHPDQFAKLSRQRQVAVEVLKQYSSGNENSMHSLIDRHKGRLPYIVAGLQVIREVYGMYLLRGGSVRIPWFGTLSTRERRIKNNCIDATMTCVHFVPVSGLLDDCREKK